MANSTPYRTPKISISLRANLFPDSANYSPKDGEQFYLFTGKIKNDSSDEAYRISALGTPLLADEYFHTDLEVIYEPDDPQKREVLKGDYFHIKPHKPEDTDFIELDPGESSKEYYFRVIDLFQIKKEGTYSVKLSCHFQSILIATAAHRRVCYRFCGHRSSTQGGFQNP